MSEQLQKVRTLDVVEMEIRVIQEQGQRVLLSMAIETGRRLEEAKAMVGHGQWGGWLKKMGYSQSTANNLMRVFREYGASQQSLFGGEPNSQALGNLSLTKAIQLLALPDQEAREEFVAEHDVENMSTRDLEKALKERDEARLQAEASAAEARTAEEARAKMEVDMKTVKASLKDQKASVRRLQTEADSLRTELTTLRARPVEVAVETREPTAEELEKLTAQAVEEARTADRERIAAMEKELAAADGDISAFKVHFDAWQDHFNKMMGWYEVIRNKNHEKVGNIRDGILAAWEGMRVV